jgi:hypothetical protein
MKNATFIHAHPALRTRISKADRGFVLADLLVGAAIGSVLVASLGGLALISEVKYNRKALNNQNLHLKWSRSLAFITNEAQQAHWISTVPSLPLGYPCSGGTPANTLVLDGPPSSDDPAVPTWRIVYGVRSNGSNSTQWKGVNRLVRCGPPFEHTARDDQPDQQTTGTDVEAASVSANLSSNERYQETFIADQLPTIAPIACPTSNTPGTCMQPFDVKLFNTRGIRDRSALVNLFLSRGDGQLFPIDSRGRFHTQLFAFRAPGVTSSADARCVTQTNSVTGNAEPIDSAACLSFADDSSSRRIHRKTYNLAGATGAYRINSCGPTCDGPLDADVNEMVHFDALSTSFPTLQYSATDTRPCSRQSCYISGNGLSVQIFDGNMLIFTDRFIRL